MNRILLSGVALCALTTAAFGGSYLLERGDVVEVTVAGAAGLHRKATIDSNGFFAMPLVGDVMAAGLSATELRDKLRDELITKNIVRQPNLTVDVEHRPIYVGGDVIKPGAYPYRVGMTVRDAVTVAEGYDLLHLKGRDPLLAAADAKGEYQAAALELAKQVAHVARMKAELANKNDLDISSLKALAVQPNIIAEVTQIERQQLRADLDDAEREKTSLTRTIGSLKEQIKALQQEETSAEQAANSAIQNYNRARELMARGLLVAARLEEAQRMAAAAPTTLYNVKSRLSDAQVKLEETQHRLEQGDDQRRIRMLQELRETIGLVEAAKVRLSAANEKIRFTGIAQTGNNEAPEIVVWRNSKKIPGDPTTILQPGDNIEVTTRVDFTKLMTPK